MFLTIKSTLWSFLQNHMRDKILQRVGICKGKALLNLLLKHLLGSLNCILARLLMKVKCCSCWNYWEGFESCWLTLKHCITLGYVSAAMFFNMVDFLLTMTQIFPIFYSKKKVQNAKKCTQRMKKVNSKRWNKTVIVNSFALSMVLPWSSDSPPAISPKERSSGAWALCQKNYPNRGVPCCSTGLAWKKMTQHIRISYGSIKNLGWSIPDSLPHAKLGMPPKG